MDKNSASAGKDCENDSESALIYFESNYKDRLTDLCDYFIYKDLPKPTSTRKSSLNASVDILLTEEHGHLLSYDQCRREFDFSNRFEAEEVEWILNKPYVDGRTAVHVEVVNRRADVLEALLKREGNPNVTDSNGQTAVHYAAFEGDGTILDILLDHGGDLYQHNLYGETPLNLLQCINSSLYKEIVHKQLSESFGFGDLQLVEKLHSIVQHHGPLDEFKDLYSQIPIMSKSDYTDLGNQTLLFRACKEGWLDGASFLLSKTKVPLANRLTNETPLHAACEGNHNEIVIKLVGMFPELLLIKDQLPYRGWYPIHTTCAYGASDEVLLAILVGLLCLIEAGNNLSKASFFDVHGQSPFYIAAKCGNLSHIHLMTIPFLFNTLKRCSPSFYAIASADISQVSIIHYAISHEELELLQTLLEKFPSAMETFAYPSILSLMQMLARMQQNVESLDAKPVIVPLLNSTIWESNDGKLYVTSIDTAISEHKVISNLALSPLAMAAAMGNAEITKLLLDADIKDSDGLALRIAIFLQYDDIIRRLLTLPSSAFVCEGSSRKLSAFPLSVDQLSSFTEIYLQKNSLVSVPLALFQIPGLTVLDVSYNFLMELPVTATTSQSYWNCPKLSTLDISNNRFTSLPSALWKIPHLSQLYAQYNSINKINPSENCSLKFKEINISNNKLTTVPLCIFYSKSVDISFNKLEELPASLWSLKILNSLNVASNSIKKINFPQNLCTLRLDIKHQSFTSKGRRALTTDGRARNTYVSRNQYGGLIKLNLANNKLQGLPDDLACFAYHLQDLNLSGNCIHTLYICSLPPLLRQITAKECELQYFGTACRVVAHSSHCFHKSHINLEKLKALKISKNCITVLNFISSLDNTLKTLKFPELEILDLSNNDLCGDLDDSIKYQRRLTALYLSGNPRLTKLPLELSYLSDTLYLLALDNLPGLMDPPKEYHSAPVKRLLSYFKSRLKSSVSYQKLSVIIVGDSMTGKTSLIKKPYKRGSKHKYLSDEIFIHTMKYSPSTNEKIFFRVWDFPSQKYSAINHCFYSKRAIYLVLFNLIDGTGGAMELDKYLRNIKIYAPGCPVIIVGTHLDQISEKEDDILKAILTIYSDRYTYPEIASVCCIANGDTIDNGGSLKEKIYNVATHLYIAKQNKLELRLDKPPDDPDALLQQKIPKAYIDLQNEIHKVALSMEQTNDAPIINKEEFFNLFAMFVEDEEDLDSAVQFLHCQNELMHFEDALLKEFYFLNIQWVFSTIRNIMKMPNTNGMVLKDDVVKQSTLLIPEYCRPGFLALLAKFDFAIPCNEKYVFIHCLLPEVLDPSDKALTKEARKTSILIPQICKIYRGISSSFTEMIEGIKLKLSETQNHSPSSRMSSRAGLFSETITDHILSQNSARSKDCCNSRRSSGDGFCPHQFPHFNIVDSASFDNSLDLSSSLEDHTDGKKMLKGTDLNLLHHPPLRRVWLAAFIPDGFWPQLLAKIILDDAICNTLSVILSAVLHSSDCAASPDTFSLWKLSQLGLAVEYDKIKLVKLVQTTNTCDNSKDEYNLSEQYNYQIELAIHIDDIVSVYKQDMADSSQMDILRLATRLLAMIEQHILDIGEEWFPGTISDNRNKEILSFVPCPLCMNSNDNDDSVHALRVRQWLLCAGHKVVCFSFKELLQAHALPSRRVTCLLHHDIPVEQLAPDMCFKDLDEDIICGPDIPLTIDKNKELGSGGSALVLRGEIKYDNIRKLVAVKIINDVSNKARSLTDFLNKYTTSLHGYREIRKEVSFLSTLHHNNLTQLSGISTNPYMLLIELAPLGSLGSILKQYRTASKILAPVLLQASMLQIASALDFLHGKHVVYLDLKSDNVLVWKFPLPGHQKTNQEVLLKITDYGISRMSSTANGIRYSSIAGTPGFIAPEVYTGKHQDLQSDKIDVFSFGMFLYELLTLLKPFELQSDSAESLIRKNQRPKIPESSKENFTPYLIQQIMQCCWKQDPNERPSMTQVIKWGKLTELKSLRAILPLEAKELICVSHCNVNHTSVDPKEVEKPSNFEQIIPECESFTPLLHFMMSQSPLDMSAGHMHNHTETEHVQIWVAHSNTKLTIISFRSCDLGYWIYEDVTTANVHTMTSVNSHMWVSTEDKKLHIIEAASMKTVACIALENLSLEVLQLLHVPEWHMVLVLWELSELWCLYDNITTSGAYLIGSLQLDRNIPIVRLCRVRVKGVTEVWATTTDKEIKVFIQSPSGCCEQFILNYSDKYPHSSDLITCLNFSTATEISVTHVWISFNYKPKLACYDHDGEEKSVLHKVSLQSKKPATSMIGHYNHLYVGTSAGVVEVYESESGKLLELFSWHTSNVDALIELPPEIKRSVCAEYSSARPMASPRSTLSRDELVPYQRVFQESSKQQKKISRSKLSGLHLIQKSVTNADAPLMVSIGSDLAESVKINYEDKSHDAILLTWTGISST